MFEDREESMDPDTAVPDLSIWNRIDRNLLYRQMKALMRMNHVAGRRCYTNTNVRASTTAHTLPLEIEGVLADNLAFIAAIEPQVDYVSAVAIEQDGGSLLFGLAANEGVCPSVRALFDHIFHILRVHAAEGM